MWNEILYEKIEEQDEVIYELEEMLEIQIDKFHDLLEFYSEVGTAVF